MQISQLETILSATLKSRAQVVPNNSKYKTVRVVYKPSFKSTEQVIRHSIKRGQILEICLWNRQQNNLLLCFLFFFYIKKGGKIFFLTAVTGLSFLGLKWVYYHIPTVLKKSTSQGFSILAPIYKEKKNDKRFNVFNTTSWCFISENGKTI